MKRLAWLVVVALLAYFAYTRFAAGTSPEVEQVRGVEMEFKAATQDYLTAMRQAAEPGLLAIADPDRAEKRVREVRDRLAELMGTLTDEKAVGRALKLDAKVRDFCERNGIH